MAEVRINNMYDELTTFCRKVASQKSVWVSGEFITSLAVGAAGFILFRFIDTDGKVMDVCRQNLGHLLVTISIIFGFASASLLHCIQIASTWKNTPDAQENAKRIVDWNALTLLCILLLLSYTVVLLVVDAFVLPKISREICYAFLLFLASWCTLQLVCHTLLLWWIFQVQNENI